MFADRDRELTYVLKEGVYYLGQYGESNNLELFYKLKTYRKKTNLLNSSYSGKIDYVSKARVKPRVQKFDFIVLEISNYLEDEHGNIKYTFDEFNETNLGLGILDKLNLIGITFKMTLS